MPNLLIELFSEEIPARMQAGAAENLKTLVTNGLVEAGLTYSGAKAFSTPRRLALAVEGVSAESPTVREERKGPKVGAPEKAIEGFLRGAGISRGDLEERETPKGAIYFATIEKEGRAAEAIIAETLEATIRNFPWPKSMRWGDGSLRWVRPLHSIICLFEDEAGSRVIDFEIDGIKSGATTEGHRFMAPKRFSVTSFDDYEAQLKRAFVVLNAKERADDILQDATNQAFANGLELVEDNGLLMEVAGLVEWPVVLMGSIDETFLDLPPEVLQTSMKEHQKFFSVRNPKTNRIERFVTVANKRTSDNGATILAGNQKVLAARLSDAKFFWENDLRVAKDGIETWTAQLSNVTFHNKLGSQAERIERISALARDLAPFVGADEDNAEKSAKLAKADLSSEMVYEFPELQGLMGRYYAKAAGLSDEIAAVSEEHYAPLGPSDNVPSAPLSVIVALADKIDTLTGFWAVSEKPTGSKDPFALRRAALGVIRLVRENNLSLRLERFVSLQLVRHKIGILGSSNSDDTDLLRQVLAEMGTHGAFDAAYRVIEGKGDGSADFKQLGQDLPDTLCDLMSFFHDRLKVHLKDEGIRHDVIDACLANPQNDDLRLIAERATALERVLNTEEGANLVQGFKRANNILKQAELKDGVEYSYGADFKYAETDEEKVLFTALDQAAEAIAASLALGDHAGAMAAMAELRHPVDAFFEAVQINVDNEVLRRNRLNLLSRIRSVCGQVADLAQLEG
ncbi:MULTISPECIES: glycine--tRNA ligase subunit beta [Lentibacter]|jgi:glycyl-tRNA synthetase beta chain|uniref:Glycine--tRNA ligase beta subunit n=1 Tax=Lentibacter algarum TaxID=576131 RepID=A0A1H3HY66_9RHOB|nr:glycine--tRNA ligase subunit beta [Lentibacter algarum]MCO4775982.1 glycine--tRNA ligase subunit beta [Lentibacter algarum]WIF31165.1 glycyl-tRNA synthetase beta subunit [Lentibacter algarum]SDY19768.1 glycyl-tRNA synthetase beta chain [Lentibacter algarum]